MSKGKGGRYLLDEDDGFYDSQDEDSVVYDDYEPDEGDFVAQVRNKLSRDQNKKLSGTAIITQLEINDYDVDKTLRALRDKLKPPAPKTTAKPAAANSSKPATAPAQPKTNKPSTSTKDTTAPGATLGAGPKPPVPPPVSSTSSAVSRVTITCPKDLDLGSEAISDDLEASEVQDEDATIVVVGHVDAGKSTLVGHLLQKVGLVQERAVQKFEQAAQSIGKSSFGLAWVMDERQDEREHGVTIDAAERRFETSRRRYTIVDTPGHRDFIPNMIKGATQANIALLILPATTGEYESAMKDSAQTKEHCFLLKAMGVNHIVLVVNKMDQTTPIAWDHGRYTHIVHDMTTFLTRDLQFPGANLHFVPVSGLTGENLLDIQHESTRHSLQWYLQGSSSDVHCSGRTLIATLDDIVLPSMKQAINKPFRALGSFNDRLYNRLSVRVLQGQLQVGDRVGLAFTQNGSSAITVSRQSSGGDGSSAVACCCPLYSAVVTGIMRGPVGTEAVSRAGPRDQVSVETLFLASSTTGTQYNQPVSGANPFMDNIDQHGGRITLFRGPVRPTITRSFVATIVLLPILREPILPGHLCELYLLGVEMPCKVAALLSVSLPSSTAAAAIASDATAAAPAVQMRPKLLRDGGRTATVRIDIATATFTAQDHQNLPAILMDRFVDCRALGRFALRSKGFTFAVGVVDEATPV